MSKGYYNNPINGEEHVREHLSDYMNGLLSDSDRKAVRAHLEECADCRADYIELRATRRAMQSLPTVPAPRAFTLTPEMARRARKPSFWESFFVPRNAPRLATGSLVAFLLLALFVGNDFLGNRSSLDISTAPAGQAVPNAGYNGTGSQPLAASTATTAAAAAGPTSTTAAVGDQSQGLANSAAAAPTSTEVSSASGAISLAVPAPNASTSSAEAGTPAPSTSAKHVDTGVTAGGNSSPTTTTLQGPPVQGLEPNPPEVAPQATTAPAPTGNVSTSLIVLQAGLLVVALGLAAGAVIAWRHK
jgi:anti-sigma factor RsiW